MASFWRSDFAYYSLKKTFGKQLRKYFLEKNEYLLEYEPKIVIISVFLFISSSFMFKEEREKKLNFVWTSYLKTFKLEHMRSFLMCSIRYLLDAQIIFEHKSEIMAGVVGLKDNFIQQYFDFFESRFKKKFLNESIDLNKYMELLDLVVKIHSTFHETIPKDSSKVVDLVNYTTTWKSKMFEVFKYKAEYIVFSFFVNLSR